MGFGLRVFFFFSSGFRAYSRGLGYRVLGFRAATSVCADSWLPELEDIRRKGSFTIPCRSNCSTRDGLSGLA